MSTGTVNQSFSPIGSNLPDFDNYYCRDCGRIVHVRKGSPGFRACPTPGCTRPTGSGVFATVARPRSAVRTFWLRFHTPQAPGNSHCAPTPAEIYFGRTPAHLSAIPPPRGRPREGPMDLPFRIDYLDAERMLPVLTRKLA